MFHKIQIFAGVQPVLRIYIECQILTASDKYILSIER